jgi:GT2 family glycosyltransferase
VKEQLAGVNIRDIAFCPRIFCVILNTNRRDDTLACLASLNANTFANVKALVLDNASKDGSVEAIRSAYPEAEIIALSQNLGYAGNNNVGIRAALKRDADWVLVLNEDTILDPECLAHLVAVGESDPSIGIVGPMVYHFDKPDVIQSAGGKLGPHWESVHLSENQREQGEFLLPHEVDWISGCGIMVRRGVIENQGVIDERYFYYWEETEWCIRAAKGGWRIVHVPQAKLWHKGVQSDYQPNPQITYYSTRNRLLTLSKHGAPASMQLVAWVQFARTLASWTIRPKWRGKREHRNAMCKGISDYLRGRWGQMQ